jgi:tRNA threonylcarbamoyladenosine biosynthesis protein TsaB
VRTLVIDTATKACSVALYDGLMLLASRHEVIGRGHAEQLLPFIATLPDKGRANAISVNVGPGSFTGIRVGVAAARALGLAWNIPVSGYNCLNLIAAMATDSCAQAVDVAMTGGHGEYFFQCFGTDGLTATPFGSLTLADAVAASQAAIVAGDVAEQIVAARRSGRAINLFPDAKFWHLIHGQPVLPANPIYGRAPDAQLPKGKAA